MRPQRGSRKSKNVVVRATGHGPTRENAIRMAQGNAASIARQKGLGPLVGEKNRPKMSRSRVKGMPFKAEVKMLHSPSPGH
jgi:hypothetical protein